MSTLKVNSIQDQSGLDLASKYIRVADTGAVSGVSSLTIDGCFTTAYDVYKIYFTGVNTGGSAASNCVQNFMFRQNGTDWVGTVTQRKYRDYSGHTTFEVDSGSPTNGIVNTGPYNRIDRGVSFEMVLFNPADSNYSTFWDFRQNGFHPSNDFTFPNNGHGGTLVKNSLTGIRYYTTVETFSSARLTVYGMIR
jgi:hypothetical protein